MLSFFNVPEPLVLLHFFYHWAVSSTTGPLHSLPGISHSFYSQLALFPVSSSGLFATFFLRSPNSQRGFLSLSPLRISLSICLLVFCVVQWYTLTTIMWRHFRFILIWTIQMAGFPSCPLDKESACNAGDPSSVSGLGRPPGEGNGNPLQYSCLDNPIDRGAWWATVHGVTKSQTQLSD